ncbi:helix-turn-helix domain-containing protein [Enterococcus quebecensis]|uniref:Mga helix-turn-helix domain-containing protein n=1 Tax=Enterococcus quebecensis TaxID=903983 RepID=A0A1E5GR42_9ENTE|nr:helix-turn-helix domain-containing protein [Enterococcus quebecensis]OEG15191.1 hypothetical protein BCR23_10160 [Enterococcus quebecensis]OJG74769.1 hypothetical protein RV12_GL002186 [Enterococcus quebecensis]
MNKKFMKKNEANKFDLFKKIVFSIHGISIQEIIDQNGDSKSTIYRYIQQINEDLTQAFPNQFVQINQKSTLLFISIPESMNVAYVIDYLRFYYITVSPEYTIFAAAADKNYSSLESLAQSVNLSPSYTYKNLTSLNRILKPFNIKTAFGDDSNKTNIYGKESDIRFFLFFGYWSILKGLFWPFYRSPKYFEELPTPISTTLSPSQDTRIRYFQNITYWRILYLQEKIIIEEDFLSYLLILNNENPTTFTISFDNVLSDDELKTEQAYFGYLARFFISDIDTNETKKRTAQLLIDSDLPLAAICKKLLTLLQKKYNLLIDTEDFQFFFYHLMIALLYIKYIRIDYETLWEQEERQFSLDSDDDEFYIVEKELYSLTRSFFKDVSFSNKKISDGLVNYMVNLLYYIIDSSKKIKPLKIFCQYSKNFYTVGNIKTNLLTIFGEQVIHFSKTINDADIVISDCYEGNIDNNSFFYFDNPFDPNIWKTLSAFVNSQLHNTSCFE